MIPGEWIVAVDPVLRRPVWLLRRTGRELSLARRDAARPGRLRWLQKVDAGDAVWDAFEATPGVPFSQLAADGKRVPWGTLRHWLHDLASELWDAAADQTLPPKLSLDHIWITVEGRAILLDEAWPGVGASAEYIGVGDLAGQQRFLNAVASRMEFTTLPVHARPVLQNLAGGKFEKLSFLTGTLRGLLEKPAEISRGIRAGSIFMFPLYIWVAVLVGGYHDKPWHDPMGILMTSGLVVLASIALVDLLGVPFRSTISYAIFRLAIVNAKGEPASRSHLLVRWAIVWVPLLLPIFLIARAAGVDSIFAIVLLLLWAGAAVFAAIHPHRGFQDRLARTWVVRR